MIETMTDPAGLSVLRAVVVLGMWCIVMLLWMYATRLPAMRRAGVAPQQAMHPGGWSDRIPSEVRRVADNYNHLFEQPTLFYAIALLVVFAGMADDWHARLAWLFVGLRIAHSLVQATVNRVMLRFTLFSLSWVALGAMIVRVAAVLF